MERHRRLGRGAAAAVIDDRGALTFDELSGASAGAAGRSGPAAWDAATASSCSCPTGAVPRRRSWARSAWAPIAVPLDAATTPACLAAVLADCAPAAVLVDAPPTARPEPAAAVGDARSACSSTPPAPRAGRRASCTSMAPPARADRASCATWPAWAPATAATRPRAPRRRWACSSASSARWRPAPRPCCRRARAARAWRSRRRAARGHGARGGADGLAAAGRDAGAPRRPGRPAGVGALAISSGDRLPRGAAARLASLGGPPWFDALGSSECGDIFLAAAPGTTGFTA